MSFPVYNCRLQFLRQRKTVAVVDANRWIVLGGKKKKMKGHQAGFFFKTYGGNMLVYVHTHTAIYEDHLFVCLFIFVLGNEIKASQKDKGSPLRVFRPVLKTSILR